MSTRKLRPRTTKKDYSKMASGEITASEDEALRGNEAVRKNVNKNKTTNFGNGGNILGEEFYNHDSDSLEDGECSPSDDDEITDAEVANVEKKLRLMKLEEKRLKKEEKYRRLSQEAVEVEKSIKELKKKNKKGKKKVTNVELRGMKDIMDEVDKLMDDKVRKNPKFASSSSSDAYVNSSSEEGSEVELKKRKVAKKMKAIEQTSGKCKSGKDKQITSLVKKQEDWPHTYLGLHFINQKKDYEELTLAEFCAGYAAILEECRGSLLVHRISHFKELMYLATK